MNPPKPLWNPYAAGALLGVALLLTFVITGHGLGASGFATRLTAAVTDTVAPVATQNNAYLGAFVANDSNPLDAWITWEVIGVALGALIGAITAGRFRISMDGPRKVPAAGRLALALSGGLLAGFGARVAVGCTSGLGLSGAAVLSTAGFLFLIGFFGAGAGIGLMMRRLYQ